jgi:hypothetical protein
MDYINLFFIPEIKSFLFQKFNLKISFAMESNITEQTPQKEFDEIEKKEYNKKEIILICVG